MHNEDIWRAYTRRLVEAERRIANLERREGSPGVLYCHVYHNTGQSTSTGVGLSLAFNSERVDTYNMHDTVTNNSRITIPTNLDGFWVFGLAVAFAANVTGHRQALFRLNGSTNLARDTRRAVVTASNPTYINIMSQPKLLSVGDYVEVRVQQTSGGNLNVLYDPEMSPEFWAIMLK